ncbi:helix-turn-helix domain-containing protein [Fibrobacterota bacterium]
MIDADKRQAVLTLFKSGKSKKHIARLLEVDIKTVRQIIRDGGNTNSLKPRSDNIDVDDELLKSVYHQCDGFRQRVHEVLSEEHGLEIAYSTLTRKIREAGLGHKVSSRSCHEPDVPGDEMQQDTSPYTLMIGGVKTKVICSGLYLRYSKMRYISFYRRYDRFAMKCSMEEALRFWGYSASHCIIDNTSLAIWYGSGSRAVFVPEMVNFARNYGFEWKAHEIGHHNRKAGKERNFRTVETNFFPGRSFKSLEDLNEQAFQWATDRYAKRPQAKTGLIPIDTFEHEKPYLFKLPEYISPVCRPHNRILDEYGYAAFQANFYWVPEYDRKKNRIREVKIMEYAKHLELYHGTTRLVRYDLPPDGIRNERFAPPGVSLRYKPRHRKRKSQGEEKELRGLGRPVCEYLDFVKSKESGIYYRNQYVRQLYLLSRKMSLPLLRSVMERALKYRVNRMETLSAMASRMIRRDISGASGIHVHHDYMDREAFIQGRFGNEPGFDDLEKLLDKTSDNEAEQEESEDG